MGSVNEEGWYHDFYVMREGERAYNDYRDLLGRKDSPLKISDNALYGFMCETLCWVPSINPSNPAQWSGFGFNPYGPTVINRDGGTKLAEVCRGWAQILAQGDETLTLFQHWTYTREDPPRPKRSNFQTRRDPLVAQLTTLAEYGELAATGDWFVLHIGI